MNIFIPPIKTKLALTEPWTFALYSESRNDDFIDALRDSGSSIPVRKRDPECYWNNWDGQLLCSFTLPKDTQLVVNRIYIRQGNKEYDSVTFHATTQINGKKVKGRFWAKLEDVNRIQADIIS